MLVLTRCIGEKIVINDDIKISVVDVDSTGNKKVSFGIAAPKEVEVHREEIYRRIKAQREEAK